MDTGEIVYAVVEEIIGKTGKSIFCCSRACLHAILLSRQRL